MGDTALGIFQETLIQLIRGEWQLIPTRPMRQRELIISLNEYISYMREFLMLTEEKRYKHPKVMNLVKQIKDTENIVEFFVFQEFRARNDVQVHPSFHLGSAIEEIKTLTAEIKQICDEYMYDVVNRVADKKLKQRVSKIEGIHTLLFSILIRGEWQLISKRERELIISLNEDISYMRGFLKLTEKKRYKHPEVMNLLKQIKDIVSEAENIVELFVVEAVRARNGGQVHPSLHLGSVIEEIKTLKAKMKQICDKNMYDVNGVADKKLKQHVSKTEGGSSSLGESNTSELGVVGFKEEVNTLLKKLFHGEQLEKIAIIGAGGSGKTTLARQVYEHQLTKATFVRAWVTVSQDYDNTMKRNLLIPILKSTSSTESGDYEKKSDDDLGEEILKCLKGKKYLIVMDDMWSIEAWNDNQRSFPRECNGSKVLFTCRMPTEPNSISNLPHRLDPLTESYSWELLQEKL